MWNYKTTLNTKTSLGALKYKAEKSYITRVPSLHYGALNTSPKNNETLI